MARIIDIDALIPRDVELRWRGEQWFLPGDLEVQHVLAIQGAAQRLEAEAKAGDEAAAAQAMQDLAEAIATVLGIRQPDRAQGLVFRMRELGLLAGAIVTAVSGKELPGEGGQEGNGKTVAGT